MAKRSIVLYDLPWVSQSPLQGWSHNTLKTRFALEYKGLPFETKWTEYPDIVAELSGKPYSPPPNDPPAPSYTCPAVYVSGPDGGEVGAQIIMDSLRIAEFLDREFPARPLFRGTPQSQAAQREVYDSVVAKFHPAVVALAVPTIPPLLPPRSAQYFRRTRAARWKVEKLEELTASKELVVGHWEKTIEALDELAALIDANEAEGKEVLSAVESSTGKLEPTYAALVLVAVLAFLDRVGTDDIWPRIRSLNGGKWKTVWQSCAPYMK